MGKQSNKPTQVSQEQYDKDLNKSLEILHNDGASDQELVDYTNDYKSRFIVEKKNPNGTVSTQKKSGELVPKNGSLGTPKMQTFNGFSDDQLKKLKGEQPKLKEITLKPKESVQNKEQKLDLPSPGNPLEVKNPFQISPKKESDINQNTIVANQAYDYAIKNYDEQKSIERLNDELNVRQFTDGIKDGLKGVFNTFVATPLNVANEALGGNKDFRIGEYKPLESEIKTAKKELEEELGGKTPIPQAQIQKRAEEIFLKKDKIEQLSQLIDESLPSGYDREGVWKELKLDQLKSNDKLRSTIASVEVFKNQIQEFENYAKKIKSKGAKNGFSQEETEQFNLLREKAIGAVDGLKYIQGNYDNYLKEAKTDNEKLELFKYNYDDFEKNANLLWNTTKNIVAGTTKLIADTATYASNKVGLENPLSEAFSEMSSEELNKNEKENEQFYRYKASNINSWSDLGSLSSQLFSEQVPVLASIYMGGNAGVAAVSLSSGGQKINELEEQAKQPFGKVYSDGEKLVAGYLYAGAEFFPEKFGTARILKDLERTVSSASSSSRKLFTDGFLKNTLSGIKKTASNTFLEGGTEYITAEGQIAIDSELLGIVQSDYEKNQKRSESFFSGGLMGGAMSAVGGSVGFGVAQSKLYSDRKDIKKVQDILASVDVINSEIENNKSLSESEKKELYSKMNEMNNQAFSIVEKNAMKGANLSVREKSFLLDVNENQSSIREKAEEIKNSNYSREVKKAMLNDLKKEFETLEENRNKTLNGEYNASMDSSIKTKLKQDAETQTTTSETQQTPQPKAEVETQVNEVSSAISELEKQRDAEIEALKSKRQYDEKNITPIREKYDALIVKEKSKETEAKIKRKDLFQDGGTFSNQLGESGIDSVPTNHQEINGIEFVEFSNPNTGIVDVIMSGTSDSDFVGYYRVYENGKPTEKWSSKFENQSRNKENFKTMIGGVQSMLPKGHLYTEKTSISTDGLRVWEQQLSRGYEIQTDNNGNIVTNEVAINGDAIVNELGIDVNQGNFDNISVTNNQQFNSVKKALIPYLEKLGLTEQNIRWENGTVFIDLPVLKQKTNNETASPSNIEPNADVRPRVEPMEQVGIEEKPTTEVATSKNIQSANDIRPTEGKTQIDYALEQIDKGILQWSGDINSPRIDLGMSWADIRKGESDLKIGKTDSVPAKRLLDAFENAKKEGGYRYKMGTGGANMRSGEFVTFEDLQRATNEVPLTDAEIEEINQNEEKLVQEYYNSFDKLTEEEQNEILENYEGKTNEPTKVGENTKIGNSKNDVSNEEETTRNFKREKGKSSVLKRIREGGNSEEINKIIDKIGLNYEGRKQEQVYADGVSFVKEVGVAEAYNAIKSGELKDSDTINVVYATILQEFSKMVENEISKVSDPQELSELMNELDDLHIKIYSEFKARTIDAGRGSAILNFIYNQDLKIKYSLSQQIENFKKVNNGIVSKEILAKLKELDEKYQEANKRVEELESLLKEAQEQNDFENIIEEEKRQPKLSKTKREKAEKIIKALDDFEKSILRNSYSDATLITPILIQGIRATKLAIKQGVDIAEAIEKGIDGIKKELSKLGKNFDNEERFRNDLSKSLEGIEVKIKQPKITVKNGKVKIPTEIIKDFISKGGNDLSEFAIQVKESIKNEFPDVSVRDIRESVSNYGKKANKSRPQIVEDIQKLKSEERLRLEYEDLQNRISKEKNEAKKRTLSQTETRLKAQIKQLQNDLGITESERTNRSVNYTKKRIEILKEKIKNNDFSKKEIKPIVESKELRDAKIEKNRIQEEFDYLSYEQEIKNRTFGDKAKEFAKDIYDSQRVTLATGEMSFVGAQGGFYMVDSTFSRKTLENLIKNFKGTTSKEWRANPFGTALKMIKSAHSAESIMKMFSTMGTANNYLDFQRMLKEDVNYDLYLKSGLRILGEDIKSQVKDDNFIGNNILMLLKIPIHLIDRIEKQELKKLKLSFAETEKKRTTLQGFYEKLKTGKISDKNKKTATEIFSNANPLSTFERGNTVFMNMARIEMFNKYAYGLYVSGKNPIDHLADFKKLGSAINTITGSGNMSQTVTMALPVLNKVMFSARYFSASWNLTPPFSLYYLAKLGNYDGVEINNPSTWKNLKPTVAQKAFVKPMIKAFVAFYGLSLMTMAMINASIDDDDEMPEEEKKKKRAYIEYDPRSSNFMQVVSGNVRTDYFGPYRGNVVLLSKLLTGQSKNKQGEIVENGGEYGSRTDFQIGTEYLAGKANPFPGMFIRYSQGKKEDVLNLETGKIEEKRMLFDKEIGIGYQMKNNVLPIFITTVKDIINEDPVLGATFYNSLALFGKQSSVYKDSDNFENKQAKLAKEYIIEKNKSLETITQETAQKAIKEAEEKVENLKEFIKVQKKNPSTPYYISKDVRWTSEDLSIGEARKIVIEANEKIQKAKIKYNVK